MSDHVVGSAWYLAQARPNQSHTAEHNLARQGFLVFAPKQEGARRRGSRFVGERQPLFPGYLFVAFNPASSAWRTINSTYGVSKLVSFGAGVPAPVPRDLVAGLIARCDASGYLLPPEVLKPGDNVQVLNGPFAQFVATVESLAPQRRVWVLLDILGTRTRVSLEVGHLRMSPQVW
jgi:transcriptional antiterminator RfaH